MAIHELISNKNTIRICGNKTFYKKLFYVNGLEDIAAMNAPGSVYVKYPAGTAALCAEDSTVYVLVRDDNPYGEVNEENARYEPMTDGPGVTTEQLEAALATKEDKRVIVDGTPNADFSVITLSYDSEPVTGADIFDWLQGGKDVVIHIFGGEGVYVVLRCAIITEDPVFYGIALNAPGMPPVSLVYGQISKDNNYSSYVTFADIVNKNTAVVEQTAPSSITLADNTEYYLTDVADLTLTFPTGNFECWISLTTAASGTVNVTLPTSQYIGSVPAFGNGETWEISIKNSIVVAVKVGDGT